jgi:hypothetical protein
MKRQRGRNRSGGGGGGGGGQGGGGGGGGKSQHNVNRAFDSNGPDNVKIRGHAQHVYEKYQQLARDASSGGDRVLAENYLQHAEHYFRILRSIQPHRTVSEIMGRDAVASGFDIDFEDENGDGDESDGANGNGNGNGNGESGGEAGSVEDRGDRQEQRGEGQQRQDYRPEPRQDNRQDRQDFRSENRPDARQENRSDSRPPREGGGERQPRRDEPRRDEPRRDRFEGRRDDRPGYGERRPDQRGDEPRAEAPREPAIEPEAADSVRVEAGSSVLRSQDGGVSHAPAFLQAPTAAPAADEAPRPARAPRTRTRRPAAGKGDSTPAEAPEEV